MITLVVAGLALLVAHLVSEWLERKRLRALPDHDAADRALRAVDPEFAAELGYEPPKRVPFGNGALSGIIADLRDRQQALQARDYARHLEAQQRQLANMAMQQDADALARGRQFAQAQAPPNPGPLGQMLAAQQPPLPKGAGVLCSIGGMGLSGRPLPRRGPYE